jgi:hypothetical protein
MRTGWRFVERGDALRRSLAVPSVETYSDMSRSARALHFPSPAPFPAPWAELDYVVHVAATREAMLPIPLTRMWQWLMARGQMDRREQRDRRSCRTLKRADEVLAGVTPAPSCASLYAGRSA